MESPHEYWNEVRPYRPHPHLDATAFALITDSEILQYFKLDYVKYSLGFYDLFCQNMRGKSITVKVTKNSKMRWKYNMAVIKTTMNNICCVTVLKKLLSNLECFISVRVSTDFNKSRLFV